MAHKQRTAGACSLSCRSLRSQFRTANAETEGVTMFNERRSAVLKLAGSLFWDFHFQIRLLCLSDYSQLSDLYGHVNRQTDPHHYGNSSLLCTPQCTASSALNLQLQSKLIKQRHKQKSLGNNAGFLSSSCQFALTEPLIVCQCRWNKQQPLRFPFIQPQMCHDCNSEPAV